MEHFDLLHVFICFGSQWTGKAVSLDVEGDFTSLKKWVGLGIEDLKVFNKALLDKWLWISRWRNTLFLNG